MDLLSRLDLFCWSDCNLGSVKSECTIPGFLLLFRLGRDDSTVFFSGWNRLIGRDVGGQRWSSLIGPPELLHSHLKCTCSGAAKMTAWCARRKSHPRRGRGRAVTRKRCRCSLSSMTATELADVVWIRSAKAASSEMSDISAARHCALVDGGSSERNLFVKKYVSPQTCAGRAACRLSHRTVGLIPACKVFIPS